MLCNVEIFSQHQLQKYCNELITLVSCVETNFSLRVSSIRPTKSTGKCEFGHIYTEKKSSMENFIFVQCTKLHATFCMQQSRML